MEFLKEVLGDLYPQLEAKLKGTEIKLADLSKGEYVSLNKYNDALKAVTAQLDTMKATLATRDADLADLNTKLQAAQTDAGKLSELQAQLQSLQAKYDTDTKTYEEQLKKQAYATAVKDAVAKLQFTSESARKAFMQEVEAKQLPLEGDRVLGLDDFVAAYRMSDPGAFKEETPPTPPQAPPVIVLPTQPTPPTTPYEPPMLI